MLPPIPFIFIRHGQTDYNTVQRFAGPSPAMLTEKGKQQALQAGEKLTNKGLTRIITSPLQRAVDTATLINQNLNLPIIVSPDIAECSFGSWEGRLYKEVCKELNIDPETFDYLNLLPPDAVSFPNATTRAQKAFTHSLTTYPEDFLLFVSHGGVFTALHNALFGHPEEPSNASPILFTPTKEGSWELSPL